MTGRSAGPGCSPSGWAFEFHNDSYPDIDDTAEVLLALRRAGLPGRPAACRGHMERGIALADRHAVQGRRLGRVRRRQHPQAVTKLPFCDFGEVIDPPSADVTAHAVEALAAEGLGGSKAVRRGVAWLLRAPGARRLLVRPVGRELRLRDRRGRARADRRRACCPASRAIRRAVGWLVGHQNPDGGWGEDLRSYDGPDRPRGRAAASSTASQTAWALLALLAAGGADGERAIERGVGWLARHQRPDGSWDEPQFTGTGFPGDFYINYHLYRLVFPVSALGRYLSGPAREPAG